MVEPLPFKLTETPLALWICDTLLKNIPCKLEIIVPKMFMAEMFEAGKANWIIGYTVANWGQMSPYHSRL